MKSTGKKIVYCILMTCFSLGFPDFISAQQYADKKYYLIDSLNLDALTESDRQLIDSSIKEYYAAKSDTLKITAINTIVETSWDENVWPKYNLWLYHFTSKKLEDNPKGKTKITLQKCLASTLSNIGFLHYQKGNFEQALLHYEKALKTQNELDDEQGKCSSYNNMALVYQALGNIESALKYFEKSLKLKKQLGDKDGMALSYNNLADIYGEQGNIPLALEYHHKSLKIKEQTGNKKGMAESYINIAMVHSRQKDFNLAIDYDNKALKIFQDIGDKQGISAAYANLGTIYKSLNDYDKAFDFYYKSLALDEETGNKVGMADSYNKISSIYYSQKNLAKSEEYILKSLKINEEAGYRKGMAISYQFLGKLKFESGDIAKAIFYSEKGLRLAEELGFPAQIKTNSGQLSLMYAKKGDYRRALEMRNLEIKMRDSLDNEEAYKAAAQQQAKYEYEKQFVQDSIKNAEEKKVKDAQIAEQRAVALQQDAELKSKRSQQYALFGGLALLIIFLGFMYNRFRVTQAQKNIIEKQKDEVQHQKELVDEKNKEILDSIRYAKRIQDAILPSMTAMQASLKNGFVLYKPKDVVAGDFYWMEKHNGRVYFAAADCTGHGVPGAMVSVICSNALSKALVEEKAKTTGELLDKTREIVIERLAKSGDEVKDGMDISLCAIDFEKLKLQWSGANNPLWIISQNKDASSSFKEFKPDKQPIGKYSDNKSFTTHNIDLKKEDTIYIFTDGYQDQFGGDKGKKFKAAQLKEKLLTVQHMEMEEQKIFINSEFEKWKGSLEQIDDICVIGVRL